MGVVYRADHVYIHKPAAVKVLHRRYFQHPEAVERFLHEAQTASVIDHPNIVAITDFGEAADGTVFLVMAHVEGTGLDKLIRDSVVLPLFRTLGILNQVTRALAAAHGKGVVHRDLKPENILLANRPGRREIVKQAPDGRGGMNEKVEMEDTYDFVTVCDFGAAKFWHQSASPLENGTVIGTPVYMAPETARIGVADARSDVYAVGVIFYEMLTGSVPFDGDTAVDIMVKHVNEPVELPRRRNPRVEITTDSERVILRAMAKDPDRRYQNMEELNVDLQECYGSVRFKRRDQVIPIGASFDSLRTKPVALTPDKMKRRDTPPPPAAPSKRPSGSGPVPLTKKKSERHKTLPYISITPRSDGPPDDE